MSSTVGTVGTVGTSTYLRYRRYGRRTSINYMTTSIFVPEVG